jgi:hypothetical protein
MICMSACFNVEIAQRFGMKFGIGLCTRNFQEFSFDSYRSYIPLCFNETQIERYQFSQKRLVVQKIGIYHKI